MNQQMEKTKLKTKNANKCAAAGMCGGCTYINGSYEKQLTEKGAVYGSQETRFNLSNT